MKVDIINRSLTYFSPVARRCLALLVFLCSLNCFAQAPPSREYNIKAVFLYNFTQFIEWPSSAFNNAAAPFIIGIYGDDPFESYIDETVAGEKVNGRAIIVRRYDDIKEVRGCHILYVSVKEALRVKEILSALPNKNMLTVSDIPNFARSGGMVHFLNQSNKIRLQINSSAAKAADLNISSKLLRVAEIVNKSE